MPLFSFTLLFFLCNSPPALCLFSMDWRRRRRRRRRRKRPWSRPAKGHWHVRRRRSREAAETTTRKTRRASSTLSSSFCPDLYRICSRSKKNKKQNKTTTKEIKQTLNSGSGLAWARLRGGGRRGIFVEKGWANFECCRFVEKKDWWGGWMGYL